MMDVLFCAFLCCLVYNKVGMQLIFFVSFCVQLVMVSNSIALQRATVKSVWKRQQENNIIEIVLAIKAS